jgi:hypothetical protein
MMSVWPPFQIKNLLTTDLDELYEHFDFGSYRTAIFMIFYSP